MADDIVTRLRQIAPIHEGRKGHDCIGEAAAEIERLRRLGDTLAWHVRAENAKEMYSAVHAWEEARRG